MNNRMSYKLKIWKAIESLLETAGMTWHCVVGGIKQKETNTRDIKDRFIGLWTCDFDREGKMTGDWTVGGLQHSKGKSFERQGWECSRVVFCKGLARCSQTNITPIFLTAAILFFGHSLGSTISSLSEKNAVQFAGKDYSDRICLQTAIKGLECLVHLIYFGVTYKTHPHKQVVYNS